MITKTIIRKQNTILEILLDEIRSIKNQLGKFLLLIPEESLKKYKNSSQIKKDYLKSIKSFLPK